MKKETKIALIILAIAIFILGIIGVIVVGLNNNAIANIQDYKLSRYICYLIVQNADPSKEVVALGQTYFAIQTRKQEIT